MYFFKVIDANNFKPKQTMIVPNTTDGKFRVPCQRSGNFQSPTTFKWPNCTIKPLNVCQPVPTAPAGYVSVNPPSLFMKVVAEKYLKSFQINYSSPIQNREQIVLVVCQN